MNRPSVAGVLLPALVRSSSNSIPAGLSVVAPVRSAVGGWAPMAAEEGDGEIESVLRSVGRSVEILGKQWRIHY